MWGLENAFAEVLSHRGGVDRLKWVMKGGVPMAHVPLNLEPKGLVGRISRRVGRKRFGIDAEPMLAASHHNGVLIAFGALETSVDKGWKKLDPSLRWLAVQRSGMLIGCSWCVDYGYYIGMNTGFDPAKVRALSQWRESDLYDARERAVLDYAELATQTPAVVSDEVAAELHRYFSDAEIVELAGWVALENFRSRFNAGLGLHSQGFSGHCAIPMRDGAAAVG
jgi:alkylhydroperoxidase family enzyme